MRRFSPRSSRFAVVVRLFVGASIAAGLALTTLQAQIPGRNVNMVSGTGWPEGDPFLQRQNEPSVAASTRNPLHLLGGSNDYRTVDVPGLPDGEETGDAWLGLFKSTDGGQRWTSTLLPGYPQDQSPAGLASPLKSYQAGADAVVRAGTNGLLYYSGLVFDRGDNGKSGIFLARFIDNNNKEAGDPIAYLGTSMVAQSSGAKFLDKPWMAVDIPRGNAGFCTVTADSIVPTSLRAEPRGRRESDDEDDRENGRGGRSKPAAAPGTQRIPAGAVYVAYSSITGDGPALRSQILLTRSVDCGATWSAPMRVSRSEDQINQGASITIDPRTGTVYVGWRRFDPDLSDANDLDGIMLARLPHGSNRVESANRAYRFPKPSKKGSRKLHKIFEHREARFKDAKSSEVTEEMDQFDLGTTGFNFRTNAYPTLAADGSGRVYMAWTQRGFVADSGPGDGARIVIATTRDGRNFTAPRPVDDHADPGRGHQLMPSMAFAGGKLMLVFYDLRETRAQTFNRLMSDANTATGLRHTIDIRSAMATPGDFPEFAPSVRVSDYLMGINPRSGAVEPLQVNPPNLPMFKQGTVPFMGDYIDVAAAPAFVPTGNGKWAYNTADTGAVPVFHAVWTDNRDVRPPRNGEWWNYTPAKMSPDQPAGPSIFDPAQTVPQCTDGTGNPGSRNQNIYSARITGGLLAGSPGNAKPLSPELQRGFVVFAQNTTRETRSYRMTILAQPPGGRASFEQFPLPPYTSASPAPETAIEMIVPPLSTASRTVYVTSTDANASINVDVSELVDLRTLAPSEYPTAPEKTDGLEARVLLNPDIENPDIENPDIENPDIENPDIENTEVYNPDIENPDIENPDIENPDIENVRVANPDIENPDIENPDIENPDIENVRVANPDIENPDIENPDIENPDIENPDIENPDIENPDIENGSIADITWQVSNTGNTTASFNVNLFLANQSLPTGVKTQLILLKTYRTPVAVPNGCQLGFQTRNILLANIRNPQFVPPTGEVSNANDPAETNATLWLAPGEEGRIVLRVIDDDTSNNLIITKDDGTTVSVDPSVVPTEDVSPVVQQQAVDTDDAEGGETEPEPVLPPVDPIPPTVVVNANDSGPGSLRAAMEYANATPGSQTITFDISYASPVSPAVIAPATPLPVITDSVVIDGQSEPDYDGKPVVEVSGGSAIVNGFVTNFDLDHVSIRGLAVTRFTGMGIQLLQADTSAEPIGHIVEANYIGTDRFGAAGKGNGTGLELRRDRARILNNVIAGNANVGILVSNDTDDAVVSGNLIGLSPVTDLALANGGGGIRMYDYGSGVGIDGNTIAGNGGPGIDIQNNSPSGVAGTRIVANRIGLNLAGAAVPNLLGGIRINNAPGTAIGEPGNGNVIAGNANADFSQGGPGILVAGAPATPPVIMANRIGTDPAGQVARPNRWEGIVLFGRAIIGGSRSAFEGNLIAGNGNPLTGQGTGIAVLDGANGSVIRGNVIGLNGLGAALGNGFSGITVYGSVSSVTIGGATPDEGNVISGNPAAGVAVYTVGVGPRPQEIDIQGNAIYDNGGLGIDLDLAGGSNNAQPAPAVTTASLSGVNTTIAYSTAGFAPGTYRLDFYVSPSCDAGGSGEGQTLLGTLGGVAAGAASNVVMAGPVALGNVITATATDSDGNTSEFSACATVAAAYTVTAAIGGPGGGAFGPYYCPAGATAVGFRVATNDTPVNDPWGGVSYALTAAEVICSGGGSTAKFGGGPIPNTDLACAPGDVMVGMVGSLAYPYGPDPVVGGLAPRCQSPLGGAITEPWVPRPSGVSNAGPFDCPAGQVVKGVQGGQGAVLDRVQLVCGMP